MEKIQNVLDSRFQRINPKSDAQKVQWERADAVIEVVKWLYFAEVAQLTQHLEPHKIISLMDYAKKHGDKPKNFFRYLVAKEKEGSVPVVREQIHKDVS